MAVDIKLKRSHTHSSIPTTSDLAEGEFAVNTYDGKMFMRDGSSNIVTVGSHYTTDFEPSTKTFYVTVATSSTGHVHHGSGSSNKYKINGVFSPFLRLIPGITYRFDQSDSSNSGHPFRFYLDENKSTSYTTGVTTNGTAGSAGAYTEIVVSHSTPAILHYQCSAHSLMGWAAFVNTSNLTAFDTGDLTEGSNLYYTDARAQAVSINNVVEDTTPQLGGHLDLNSKNITGTGYIELTAGNTYDPTGTGTDTSTNVGLALAGGGRVVFSTNGYIRNIISGTPSSTIQIGQGDTAYITGTNIFAGSSGSVKLHHATNEKLSTVSTGVNVTGDLTITDTDTGSSAGPELSLVRDSASPADADYLGQIRFLGDDDGGSQHVYSKITGKIGDASAGTEDGLIEFANVRAGTNTIVARLKSTKLQLLNSTDLEVAGNTTLSGTLNGHTIPSGSGTLALTSDISSGAITVQDEGSALSTQATTLNFVGSGVTASGTGTTKTITINSSGGGSGGSGESVSWSVAQSSHGLAVGDVIYNNGTNYVKARANSETSLGLFVVSAVADTDNFTATFSGKITLSSLTAGQFYFVSPTTAGDFTTTEPTGSNFSNPILFALSTTEAVVLPYRPALGASGAGAGRTVLDVFSKAETNQQVSAFAIALG